MRLIRIILSLCLSCFALVGQAGNADFITRLWQVEEGLPHNNVEAVAQTRDGYLWAGTTVGLARFDGVRFVVFDTNNAPSLGSSYIRALCLRRDGSLWIGTAAGTLTRLRDGKFLSVPLDEPGLGNILCLYESQDGAMWVGTETGLLREAGGDWKRFTTEDGLLHNTVRSVCEYRGRVCVATDLGANWYEDGRLTEMNPPGAGPAQYLRALWPDRSGNLWLGFRYGLGRLGVDGAFTRFTREDGLPDENENVLFEDRQTNLWIGAMGGLNRLRDGNFFAERQADGSSYGRVRCVFEDREGNIWVGTRDGLNQLRPRRFRTYSAVDGLAHNNVMSVLEDRHGTIWCAMWGGGLAGLQHGRITNFSKVDPPPNELNTDKLLSLLEEPDGSLLVGVDYEGGVFRFQKGKFTKPIPAIPEITDMATRVIFRDHQSRLWLGLHSGLVLWDTREKWLHDTVVRAIVEDHQHRLWVGTTNGLYRRKNDGAFEHFTTANGLSQNRVSSLRVGTAGELWIGTEGGGLNRFKDGRFNSYTASQGLFSQQIGDILEDDAGWLWLSSAKGIFRVRKSDFDALDTGQIESLRCIAYGREDGLATVQCNDFAKPAAWRGRDGRLWFATIKGLAMVNPRSVGSGDSKPPPVLIEEMVVDNRAIYGPITGGFVGGLVKVPPSRGDLGIRYTGLSLQVPERVRFKYKLEGRDDDWVDAGDRRFAFYSNLQPGEYRFRVAARNNDGVWNETGAELAFMLMPYFWQTWWFKVVVAAALGLAAWMIYRFRAARYRQIERLRVRIAADLHDEIGSNVASIALLSQLGQRTGTPEGDRRELSEINRIAEQTAQNIREIVWFINPDYDTLPEMIARMRDVASTMLGRVEHRFVAPIDAEPVRLSLEFRRDIFLVFKETLHNIVKHAHATRVDIEIKESKGQFHLCIQDNGRGFDEKHAGDGNGLKNLRLRMAQLGGRVEVHSIPGRGTTVRLSARITRLHEGREISLP